MTIKRFFILLCTSCISFMYIMGMPHDDVQYSSRKIKQLVENLPDMNLPRKDSLIIIPQLLKEKAVTFKFDGTGKIVHVGVSLFSQETKHIVGSLFCDFIERFFLELCEQPDAASIKSKLTEFDVKLRFNNSEFGSGSFQSVRIVLGDMDMPAGFVLNLQDKYGQGIWSYRGNTLELFFPLYRELIEGTDKKESDEQLYIQMSDIKHFQDCDEETITQGGLKPYQNNIFVKKGERFQVQAMSSDIYYQKIGNEFTPLFEENHPAFSLNNLFLTCSNGGYVKLKITHRQYGHFTPEVTVPLLSFLNMFRDDFMAYAHTAELKDHTLETIVVFNHNSLNYMHLMRVKTSLNEVFSPAPVLKADFYTNIPQHYLKTLLQ